MDHSHFLSLSKLLHHYRFFGSNEEIKHTIEQATFMGKKKSKGKAAESSSTSASSGGEDLIWVDPSRVRFQHARIRPYFSGCGRSVQETLEAIRLGKVLPQDIPPIQVCACAVEKRAF